MIITMHKIIFRKPPITIFLLASPGILHNEFYKEI